jgi:metallo-beta-lactamase family protein
MASARTITGTKHLLDAAGHRVLVDCGLFQGLKELRDRNWQPLPIKEPSINAVVLTHAHLDHCGYLPKIVQRGFRGPIFCTPATAELTRVVLEDAAKLQMEDAERANRKGYTKHQPALPLFTTDDAERAIRQMQTIDYGEPREILPGLTVDYIVTPATARVGVRAGPRPRQRPDDSLRRRSRPLPNGPCCRIRRWWKPRMCCWWNPPTAIASTNATTTANGWRRSFARRSRGAAR